MDNGGAEPVQAHVHEDGGVDNDARRGRGHHQPFHLSGHPGMDNAFQAGEGKGVAEDPCAKDSAVNGTVGATDLQAKDPDHLLRHDSKSLVAELVHLNVVPAETGGQQGAEA